MKKGKLLTALLLCSFVSSSACFAVERVENLNGGTVTVSENMSGFSAPMGGAVENAINGTVNVNSGITFSGNAATNQYYGGGAIYNHGGTINIGDNVRFENNYLNQPNPNTESGEYSAGGAIASWNAGSVNIGENAVFTNNGHNSNPSLVEGSCGGALYIDTNWSEQGNLVVGNGAEFSDNRASMAGAIFIEGSKAQIGDATFKGNSTTYGNGGAIYAWSDSRQKNDITLGKTIFDQNSSAWKGGAIFNAENSTIDVGEGSLFSQNSAEHRGGAIYNDAQIVIGKNTTFSGNHAKDNGGAIFNVSEYSANSKVIIEDGVSFNGNSSDKSGGAIYNSENASYEIGKGVSFENNTAKENGGAIFAEKNSTITIGEGAVFTGNTATQNGGAIYNEIELSLSNATFSDNSAKNGGAIYNTASGELNLNNVTVNAASNGVSNEIYNDGNIVTESTSGNKNTFASNIINNKTITFKGSNDVSGNISGNATAEITNQGDLNLSGNNLGFKGNFTQAVSNAVTTVTGKFFGGKSEISDGTLNWTTTDNSGGPLKVTGGDLNIGSADKAGVLNLKTGDVIETAVNATIQKNSTLNIRGGEATFGNGDTWEGLVDINSGTLTIDGGVNMTEDCKLQATGGTVGMSGGTLTVGEGSAIASEVVLQLGKESTPAAIEITGGSVALGNDDSIVDGSSITLNKGTLNYGMSEEKSSNVNFSAQEGHLNLLAGSYFKVSAPSNVNDDVIIDVQKGSTLALGSGTAFNLNGSTGNPDTDDKWAGTIINNGSSLTATGLTSAVSAGIIQDSGITTLQNSSNIHISTPQSSISGGVIDIKDNSVLKMANSSIINGNANMLIDDTSKFVSVSNGFKLADLTSSGVLNAMNSQLENYEMQNMFIGNTSTGKNQADLMIDVYGRSNASHQHGTDKFIADNIDTNLDSAIINISDWGLSGDIYGWDAPIDRHITLQNIFSGNISENVRLESTRKEVFTPIGWYQLNNHGGISGNYTLDLVRYNPQVFRGQVATVAQWMNQLNINDMLFTHSMVLPSFKDEDGGVSSSIMANRYAAESPLFAPYQYSRKNGGLWYKAYGTFENLQMNNGLGKVGNNAYGVLIGADFGLKELRNGWKFMPTAYIGYNGAHQYWAGAGNYQNGGQLGVMGTWYRNNLIFGALAYGGVYDNSMSVFGNTEDTFNYFGGAATKASYNIRLHRDWVLQPNLFASYNYFGQQNWHSNFGQMGMMAGDLNGVNIAPGLNLIWEKETFSTYLTLQYMYNVNGASGGRAGNVGLPHMEMDRGYIQYGIGFTKKFTDRASGYLQAVLRNAGRTGAGFQLGFNFMLGK